MKNDFIILKEIKSSSVGISPQDI